MIGTINNVQIPVHVSGSTYQKYEVVSEQTGLYPIYYVSVHDSNNVFMTGHASNASWKRFDDANFNFSDVWTPTYQTSLAVDLRPKLAQYGDGYSQMADASVFGNKLSYDVTFENISNRELKSLVSFFEYKGGVDFVKMDVPPFIVGRKFVGKSWDHNYVAEDINRFSVRMFEYISDLNG